MGKITIDEMHNSLFDYAQAISDESLMTENKTIIGAINEIYGKNLIADSIGEPLNNTDTFTKMSNDINSLLSTFKTNMMNAGVAVESGDKFKQLIDKIKGLTEGEKNKGIQFAEGSGEWITESVSNDYRVTIPTNLDFMPTYIFCFGDFIFDDNIYEGEEYVNNMLVSNIEVAKGKNSGATMGIIDITPESFTVDGYYKYNIGSSASRVGKATIKRWFVIGVGEEDTTLRDSLASILQEEGVEVTEEDNMASLISKTDNEFQENTTILYNKMKDANYNVDSSMNMDALLNELTFKTIIEGKVTQSPSTSENSLVYSISGLDFTPSLVYVTLGGVYEQSDEIESVYYNSITLNNRQSFVGASKYNTIKVNIKNNGFNLILNSQDGSAYTGSLGWTSINGISYVAIR